MDTKKCTKCNIENEVSFYQKDNQKKDGLTSWCKNCRKIERRRKYLKNKRKETEKIKEYRLKNKDHLQQKAKEYYEKNRRKIEKRRKEYYIKNREKILAKSRVLVRKKRKPKSEETRKKLSIALKGRIFSEEHKKKISESRKGFKISEETKRKLKERMMGNKYALGFKHTEETRKKCGAGLKGKCAGEKHPNWRGGITSEHRKIRKSLEYRLWREAVFRRDNWTCVLCKTRNGNGKTIIIHADHIKPFALFPEVRFEISNGRTLCLDCHKKTDTFGWNISNKILKIKKNESGSGNIENIK